MRNETIFKKLGACRWAHAHRVIYMRDDHSSLLYSSNNLAKAESVLRQNNEAFKTPCHKIVSIEPVRRGPGRPKGSVKPKGRKRTFGITISDAAREKALATGNASAYIERLILADEGTPDVRKPRDEGGAK